MRIAPQVRGVDRKISNLSSTGTQGVMPSYNFVSDLERFAPGFMTLVQ